jgi:hypothetical protein
VSGVRATRCGPLSDTGLESALAAIARSDALTNVEGLLTPFAA